MPEFLETTIDKFTFRVAADRLYTPEGVWVLGPDRPGGDRVRLGLSDYIQQHGGDLTFAHVKKPGSQLNVGEDFAEIETIKSNLSLASPVAGVVVEVNPELELQPERINQDPYGSGWLAVIQVRHWEADRPGLLEPAAYLEVMKAQALGESSS